MWSPSIRIHQVFQKVCEYSYFAVLKESVPPISQIERDLGNSPQCPRLNILSQERGKNNAIDPDYSCFRENSFHRNRPIQSKNGRLTRRQVSSRELETEDLTRCQNK